MAEASCHPHVGNWSQLPSSVGLERGHRSGRVLSLPKREGVDPREGKGHTCLANFSRISGTLSRIPEQALLPGAHWGIWLKKRLPTCILSLTIISTGFASLLPQQPPGSLLCHINGMSMMQDPSLEIACQFQPATFDPLLWKREQDSGIRYTQVQTNLSVGPEPPWGSVSSSLK